MNLTVERVDAQTRDRAFWSAVGEEAFPPWLLHADPATDVWWDRVQTWWPQHRRVLMRTSSRTADVDDSPQPVAASWAVPIAWTGEVADLPDGYTATLQRAVTGHEAGTVPTTLVVCALVVFAQWSGQGLAAAMLRAMREHAEATHLKHVLVPLRPTSKAAYPLTAIEDYARWTRPDGLPLDPWLRSHVRLGGRVLGVAPASQTLTAPVAAWEEWSGLAMPASGLYVVPGGLSTLRVDAERDVGVMVEPNIWVQHC